MSCHDRLVTNAMKKLNKRGACSHSSIVRAEWYSSLSFAAILLVLSLYTVMQIRNHESRGSGSSGRDVPENWHEVKAFFRTNRRNFVWKRSCYQDRLGTQI